MKGPIRRVGFEASVMLWADRWRDGGQSCSLEHVSAVATGNFARHKTVERKRKSRRGARAGASYRTMVTDGTRPMGRPSGTTTTTCSHTLPAVPWVTLPAGRPEERRVKATKNSTMIAMARAIQALKERSRTTSATSPDTPPRPAAQNAERPSAARPASAAAVSHEAPPGAPGPSPAHTPLSHTPPP